MINVHSQSKWNVPRIIHKVIRSRLLMQFVFLPIYEQQPPSDNYPIRKHSTANGEPIPQDCEDSVNSKPIIVSQNHLQTHVPHPNEFKVRKHFLEKVEVQSIFRRASVFGDYLENTPWKHFANFVDRIMFYLHIIVMTIVMIYFFW